MNFPIKKDFNYYLCSVIGLAALGGFLFGYETAVISGALGYIHDCFATSTSTDEMLVSSLILTAILGAASSSRYANVFGRKRLLLFAAFCYIVGTVTIASGHAVLTIMLGRLLVGFAIGISSYVTPLFIAEMAPAQYRGRLLLINGILITGGQVVALLVDYFFSFSGNWRMMFLMGTVPALVLFFGLLIVPETPRWFLLRGADRHALHALIKLRGFPYSKIAGEFREIKSCIATTSAQVLPSYKNMVPLLMVGTLLGIFQQLFGINAVIYYGPSIFKIVGFPSASEQIFSTLVITSVNACVTLIVMLVIDQMGRRPLLIAGSCIAGASLLAVAVTIHYPHLAWFTFSELILYIMGYCISVGSLFWVIISELFPLAWRGFGMGLATAVQWFANLVVSSLFLTFLEMVGPSAIFLFFSSVCFACMAFAYFFVPETKKISLEKIEHNQRPVTLSA